MAAVLLILAVCLLSLSSADGQDATHTVTGPDLLVTDGTRNLTLTCQAHIVPGYRYAWVTPGTETERCKTGPSGNVCTFTPRLEDDNQNVTCGVLASDLEVVSKAVYQVNLEYPPQSSPKILEKEDIITCTVSGGKPPVSSVILYCQNPDLADREDDVSDDGLTVNSSITVDLSNTTEAYMNCTCSATWQPEPDLYSNKTVMSFLLDFPPRVFDTSYDPSNPPILAATGRTFFLVAEPTPDTTKSYFLRTNMTKEPAPDNTFTTEFTENSSMEHLVNCRVTPQNVPEDKLGLYELSISNGLGDVSLRVNVTSPVIQHSEKKANGTGVIVGGVIGGIVLLVGIIVTIVIFVIRRKRCAGIKRQNVGKTDCRSSDSKSGTIINSEQDDYNHLNENTAPPVDSSTYSRVGADSRGAQPEGSADSATPTSIASRPDLPTDTIIGPKGAVYATVAAKQKGGNPPPTDDE